MASRRRSPGKTADELFQIELAHRKFPFTINEDGLYEVKIGEITATVNLENVRRDYARDKDPEAISEFAKQLDFDMFEETPNWNDVKPFLRFSLEQSDYEGVDDTLHEDVTDELVKIFAFTDPEESKITWVTDSMLTDWNVGREAVVRQANANMNRLADDTTFEVEEIDGVKLGMLSTDSTPFKASLILTERFRDLVTPTHGWPVYVVAPARDFVYVISSDDRDFVGRLGTVVLNEYNESGHPITPDVLEVGDDGICAIGSFSRRG